MRFITGCLLLASATIPLAGFAEPVADDADIAALEAEARSLVAEFAGKLKPQLKAALTEGGPAHAVEVCSHQAPRIADALSTGSGWNVKRVSLKARNASRAQPDSWEREILAQFDQRSAAGETGATLNAAAVHGEHYRYMQAQVVEGVCLLCHGTDLSDATKAALRDYYPDDVATGYLPGQVRGAISVSKPL